MSIMLMLSFLIPYTPCARGSDELVSSKACARPQAYETQYATQPLKLRRKAIGVWNKIHELAYQCAECLMHCAKQRSTYSREKKSAAPQRGCLCEHAFLNKFVESAGLEELDRIYWKDWLRNIWLPVHLKSGRSNGTDLGLGHGELKKALLFLDLASVWACPLEPVDDRLPPQQSWGLREDVLSLRAQIVHLVQVWQTESIRQAFSSIQNRPESNVEHTFEDRRPLHIVMVVIGARLPTFGKKALATIRSALFFAKRRPLHFDFIVDEMGRSQLEEALKMSLEPQLFARAAMFEYHDAELLSDFLVSRFGSHCIDTISVGVREGLLRLLPHEVFGISSGHIICTEAGDMVFLTDPALLIDEHIKAVAKGAVASYPTNAAYAIQVFSLHLMHSVGWSQKVADSFERNANDSALCLLAEAYPMDNMIAEYPELFAAVSDQWAFEPHIDGFSGDGKHNFFTSYPGDHPTFAPCSISLWSGWEPPGILDHTHVIRYCLDFAEMAFAYLVHKGRGGYLVKAQNFQIALSEAQKIFRGMQKPGNLCREPVSAMHLLRQYHYCVPWSLRLLDFWSRSDVFTSESRDSPNPWSQGCAPNHMLPKAGVAFSEDSDYAKLMRELAEKQWDVEKHEELCTSQVRTPTSIQPLESHALEKE